MQLKLAQLFNLPSFATSLPSLPSFSYSLPGLVASASLAGLWLLRRHLRRPTSPFSKLTGVHQWVSCVSNLSEALFEALLWYTAKHCWMLYHAKGSCPPKNQGKCIPVLSHSGEGGSQGADTIWDCSAASQRMRRGNCQRGRFHASFKSGVNQWLGNWRMCVCVFWLYSIRDKKRTQVSDQVSNLQSVDSLYLRKLFRLSESWPKELNQKGKQWNIWRRKNSGVRAPGGVEPPVSWLSRGNPTHSVHWPGIGIGLTWQKLWISWYIQVRKGLLVPDGRPTGRRCVLIG